MTNGYALDDLPAAGRCADEKVPLARFQRPLEGAAQGDFGLSMSEGKRLRSSLQHVVAQDQIHACDAQRRRCRHCGRYRRIKDWCPRCASSPHPVSLMQLRFASFAMINLRWDLHPLGRAHAGRTVKKAADIAAARNTHVAQGAPTFVPSYTSAFLTQSGISSEYVREDAGLHRPWAYRPSPNADQSGFA